MGKWDGLNRRKFPRVKYPCLVTINQGPENGTILTHTENVGIGGVCVILKQDVKMFTEVTIELDLLDLGDHIKCPGKVVWNVRRTDSGDKKYLFYDLGIEFVNLPAGDLARLEEIVKRLSKDKANLA